MNINVPTSKIKELAGYGILLGVVSFVGYITKAAYNMNSVAAKVGKSVDEITRSTHVDVSEAVVNEAVRQVAEREASRIVERAVSATVNAVRDDIRSKVKAAVDKAYSGVEDDVRRELKRKAQQLDIDDLKAEIVEKAKKDASEKLDAAMDDILEEFNGNLKNIRKIYSSISKAVTGNDD